jgi:hypothetical protein
MGADLSILIGEASVALWALRTTRLPLEITVLYGLGFPDLLRDTNQLSNVPRTA